MNKKIIHIYSYGINFTITPQLHELLLTTQYIYSSKTILEKLHTYSAKKVTITAKAKEQANDILTLSQDNTILILCSGDSLYHGFGGTLSSLAQEKNYTNLIFYPNITAFQQVFSKIGLAWENATLFTAHFSELLPLRNIVNAHLPVIYGGTKFPAHTIAKEILTFAPYFADRQAILADSIGTQNEKLIQNTLEQLALIPCSPTSILILLPFNKQISPSLLWQKNHALALGLAEEIYEKENHLITQSDIRAIIISRLRLPQNGTMWDLGAGSGSIGLEVASLTNMNVHGIEQKKRTNK